MGKLEESLKLFAIILALASIWFFLLVTPLSQAFNGNFILAFSLFLLIYTIAVTWFLLGKSYLAKPRFFFSMLITFLIFDAAMFPLLVTRQGLPELPAEAQISADVFIYKLLPAGLPEELKYFITYPFMFSVGILLIMLLNSRRGFSEVVKSSV